MAANNTIDKISIRNGNEANSFDTRDIGAAAKNVTVVYDADGNILVNGMEGQDDVASTMTLSTLLSNMKKDAAETAQKADDNATAIQEANNNIGSNGTAISELQGQMTQNSNDITVINNWKTETAAKVEELEQEVFESPIFVVDPVNYGTTLPNQGNVEGRVFFLIEEGQ